MFFIPQFMVGLENLVGLNAEALERVALAQAVDGSTETTYEYDANGNVTARIVKVDGVTQTTETYVYDSQSRLVRYEPANATPAEIVGYTYDDAGIRTSKTVGGATTWYVTDASQGLAQVVAELTHDGGSDHGFGLYHMLLAREVQATYAYGDDLISRRTGVTGDIAYYHYDGQMSTRQMTKSTVVTNVYSYDAFGGELEHGSLPTPEYAPYASPNAYRYTGEQLDEPTGLYYLRARYYDPANGRFTGRDPWSGNMSEPATLHKYAYCGADPVNGCDPSGLFTYVSMMMANSLRSMLAQWEGDAAMWVFAAAEGVAAGMTFTQVYLLGCLGLIAGEVVGPLLGLLVKYISELVGFGVRAIFNRTTVSGAVEVGGRGVIRQGIVTIADGHKPSRVELETAYELFADHGYDVHIRGLGNEGPDFLILGPGGRLVETWELKTITGNASQIQKRIMEALFVKKQGPNVIIDFRGSRVSNGQAIIRFRRAIKDAIDKGLEIEFQKVRLLGDRLDMTLDFAEESLKAFQ